MNDIIKEVTPLTRGIIWLTRDEMDPRSTVYKELDYLLDGLLTANLHQGKEVSSRVIVGKNFQSPLYVLVLREMRPVELESYLSLLKDLSPENKILVIDETDRLNDLKTKVGKISSHFQVVS